MATDGVKNVVKGFNLAYLDDDEYRVARHSEEVILPSGGNAEAVPFEVPENEKDRLFLNKMD